MSENHTNPLKIGLIADDFTGAMDSGAQFAGACVPGSLRPLTVRLRFAGEATAGVEIINTASREIPAGLAFQKNREAARSLSGRLLFKKIDSTMRGHVSDEVEAILGAGTYRKAVICPAIPWQGRVVLNGKLLINGTPLHLTAFKDDPVYPAKSAELSELMQRQIHHLPLDLVRSGVESIAEEIKQTASGTLISSDAETPEDLYTLAKAILRAEALPCGAFGLAKAFISALGAEIPMEEKVNPVTHPVLLVVGSANQVARLQVQNLAAKPGVIQYALDAAIPDELKGEILRAGTRLKESADGAQVIVLNALQKQTLRVPEWLGFGKTVSRLAADLLEKNLPVETLMVVGGETVAYLCQLLEVESIELLGDVLPGVPYGRLCGGKLDGLGLVTKAGGFGDKNTLSKILIKPESE